MTITLDSTLKTAQDGDNHRPIAQIVSSPMGEIIPTQGNYYNTLTSAESEPTIISQSTGRLGVVMERNTAIKYLYTPTDRSEFIEVAVTTPYALTAQDPCLVELTGGNVGIIYTVSQTKIYYNILTPTGTEVTAATLLYDAGTNWVANPYVILLANTNYLLVYPEGTGTPPSESNTYYLKQHTSSNFTSWGSATDITPAAFASTRYCNNPHLVQVASGRIFLHLDYLTQYTNLTELNNIYMTYSDNNGTSWSAIEQVTNYTSLGNSAVHPTAVENDSGDLIFMYPEKSLVKMLDANMTGFPYAGFLGGPIYFNPDTNQIILHHYGDSGKTAGITQIDADAWEWQRTVASDTIPAIASFTEHAKDMNCEWSATKLLYNGIQSYNHISEVSNVYKWASGKTYDVERSCGYADWGQQFHLIVERGGIQQLWIYHQCAGYGSYDNSLGWIDLNEIQDPITGLFTYNEAWGHTNPDVCIWTGTLHGASFRWDHNHDYLIFHTWGTNFYESPRYGIGVFSPASGNFVIWLDQSINSGFPQSGARSVIFMGDDIYFSFQYMSNNPDKRGLGHWHADTGYITYHQPSWATVDEYSLDHFEDMGDGRILMASNNSLANGGGIVIFDTATETFEIINDDTYPGFGRTGGLWKSLQYDPATKTIYACYSESVIAFSEYGPYSLLLQSEIDNVDSTIDYGSSITWSYHFFEYQPSITMDENYVLWGTWQHLEDGTEYSAKWANLLDDVNISDFMSIKDPISITWDIENPAQLKISLAKGHLFDPQNFMSTLSPFTRKGRKIIVEFGEMVSDTEYWQDQGEFVIKAVALEYGSQIYPIAKITGEDMRILWEDHEVLATMFYEDQSPFNVLENVLVQQGSLEASEFDIPEPMENTHQLHHQFVDMTLDDIVKEILDHFEYYPYVNVNGVFEPRHLNLEKATNHTYSDTVQMVKYTPNDAYSTFVNRVTVKGISHDYYEVLYPEESITSVSGTVGFWGKSEQLTVWYSDDHVKTCRYPRLEIIQSVGNFEIFGIRMGGGEEYIQSEDPNEHYIIIYITGPDLTGALIICAIGILATGAAAISCGPSFSCGFFILAMSIFLNIAIYILGAVATYNYNIWARPIGHEKRTFQASADDYAFRDEIGGKLITTTIDDPMCYTIAECQRVANFELGVIMAQRRRLKFKKSAHLKDEIGDIIEMIHPYSNEILKIMVANIKRTMRIGKEFTDEIEGWRIM